MTYDEIQAFYNELESRRLKIKEDLENNPSKYIGMSDDDESWIRGEKPLTLKNRWCYSGVRWLFKDTEKEQETEVVLAALNATQNPRLVEIARKYEEVRPTIPSRTQEKIRMAEAILSKTGLDAQYALGGEKSIFRPDEVKVTTVGKELEQIKKRYKKTTAREVKAMDKYTHISAINIYSLYSAFCDLCTSYGVERPTRGVSAQEFVLEHQREVTDLFIDHPQLKFAKSQKAGKLK